MVFRSKVNKPLSVFVYIYILILGVATGIPVFLLKGTQPVLTLLLCCMFLVVMGVLLWMVYFVTYTFYAEYLLIKSGPFRSRIPYKDITKVSPSRNLMEGNRLSPSADRLELFSKKTALRSVTISAKNKKEFIIELQKRNPAIQMDECIKRT